MLRDILKKSTYLHNRWTSQTKWCVWHCSANAR